MRIFLITIFLLTSAKLVFAESWICYDEEKRPTAIQGDCLALGLCTGFNNTGLKENCFEATKEEFEKAKESSVKFDPSVVTGNKIVDLTQEEKDLKIAEQTQAETDAKNAAIDNLEISAKELAQALIDLGVVKDEDLKAHIKNIGR